jgi:Tol biopolymer transport system component
MKRCPECRRDYHDDSLLYCLDDGVKLLEGPGPDGIETAILPYFSDERDSPERPSATPPDIEGRRGNASARDREAGRRGRASGRTWIITVALAVLAAATSGWLLARFSRPVSRSLEGLENVTLTPLTTEPGYEGEPTFSPDGETLAYVSDRTGNFDIFLKQVSGGPDIQLTNSTADDVQPSFSPDGKQLAFVSTRSSQTGLFYPVTDSPMVGGDIWVMSALGDRGGNARRIAENGNFPSWSPDGKEILYMSEPRGQVAKICRVPAPGGAVREVPIKMRADQNPGTYDFYPRFSSDGRWIVFQKNDDTIYVVSADGGEPQPIARGKAPVWNADSSAIIYSSKEAGRNLSLWQIPFSLTEGKAGGPARALTVGRGLDLDAAVSRNGNMIAFTAEEDSFNIETVAFDAETGRVTGEPKSLTTGQNTNFFANFSPDEHTVVFQSTRGSSTHIWRADPDSPPVQLTSDREFNDTYPRWSPDGRSISFLRLPIGGQLSAQSLWLMTADGANPQKLADGFGWYTWTPDGRAIVGSLRATRQMVRLDLATKQERPITNEEGVGQVVTVSPDGNWIAYQSSLSGNVDVRIAPVEGGESRVVLATRRSDFHPFFSPSGKWLYFEPDHKNLYRVPGPAQVWRQAEPEKVTNFPESGLFLEDPQISHDGRWFLYSHGRITGDIWILQFGENADSNTR